MMNRYSKPSYYIDGNVFLAVSSEEHKRYTRYFFSKLFENQFSAVISSITWEEIHTEHPNSIDLPFRYLQKATPNLIIAKVEDEAFKLAKHYVESGIFASEDFISAMNIAIASLHGCDAFISWDYKGIVNYICQSQITGINRLLGKNSIDLYTPAMV